MARILVTGAGGFVGQALCPALASLGHRVVAGLRRAGPAAQDGEALLLGELGPATDWRRALDGIEIVVHLAQRAHAGPDAAALAAEPETAAALAAAAAAAGARRMVLVSSVKAMGEATAPGRPFRADDPPRPDDAYGRTKLASERAVAAAADATGLALVVIRPPLVYGPGVPANFGALLRLAQSGLPLPFAALDNRRSLIFRENLADLIALAAVHPAAAGKTLLCRDGEDLSTPELIAALAAGAGRRARLFPVPDAIFAILRRIPAVGGRVARLTLSLQVDDSVTRDALGWSPPVAGAAGLAETARAFAARL